VSECHGQRKGRGKEKENKEKAVVRLSTLRVREIPFVFKYRQKTQCKAGQQAEISPINKKQAVSFCTTSISINRSCRFFQFTQRGFTPV
jgi:hypothetical protein